MSGSRQVDPQIQEFIENLSASYTQQINTLTMENANLRTALGQARRDAEQVQEQLRAAAAEAVAKATS